MEFSVNHPILFVLVGVIILAVLLQSVFFLVRAWKRAKAIGMKREVLKKTIVSSAVFTIAPAIAILVGVISLSKCLGIALPWLRLSVIGSLSYETVAAGAALKALGLGTDVTLTNASDYVTVAFVMTFGILIGLILVPLLTKKIQSGMIRMETKDKHWGEIFNNAMFLGMISAFLGYVFCDVTNLFSGCLLPCPRPRDVYVRAGHDRVRACREESASALDAGLRPADQSCRRYGICHSLYGMACVKGEYHDERKR